MASSLFANPPGDRTFIVVYQPAAGSNTTHSLFGASAAGGLQFRMESGGQISLLNEYNANIGTSTTAATIGATSILTGYYNQATGAFSFRINGADAGGSGTNVQALSATTTTIGLQSGERKRIRSGNIRGARSAQHADAR